MKDRVKKSIILIAVGIVINVALAIIKMHVGLRWYTSASM